MSTHLNLFLLAVLCATTKGMNIFGVEIPDVEQINTQ
jgi:hypothetical protein